MKKVLCISECCCDLIFGGLDGLPNLGEERYGTHFSMQAGGGANTAVLLQRCGVPTAYWTLLGDDDAGRIVRASLENSGLSLIRHEHTPCRTPVSAVLSAQGDRAFASFAQPCTLVEDYDALERAIRDADIVHTYLGYCASYPIAQLCERYGTLLSADTSFCDARTELFDTVLPHCDYWKGNEDEALRLSGKSSVSEALDAIASRVKAAAVITRGARGSIAKAHGEEPIEQEAVAYGAFVDACGAGDAFAAGFLKGVCRGEPLFACLLGGAKLSGRVVTAYGGCPETIPVDDV